jgi:hypothetical protein
MDLTPASLQAYVTVIEIVFGAQWLKKRVDKAERLGRQKSLRAFMRGWKQAKQALAAGTVAELGLSDDLAAFIVLASDLLVAQLLPNFDAAIQPRLKSESQFDKASFELHVAAAAKSSGYEVEFVLVSQQQRERTPDLAVRAEVLQLSIECKRKDSYEPAGSLLEPAWDELNYALYESVFKHLEGLHEFILMNFGEQLASDKIPGIVELVKRLAEGASDQIVVSRELNCAMSVLYRPPVRVTGNRVAGIPGNWVNRGMHAVMYTTPLRLGRDGLEYMDELRFGLYKVDAHRLESIVQSFNAARGQLPKDEVGVIYVDLDVSKVAEADTDIYMRLVGIAIKELFTPQDNTRVGAVVLSGGPLMVRSTQHGRSVVSIEWPRYDVRNPYGKLPSDFRLP